MDKKAHKKIQAMLEGYSLGVLEDTERLTVEAHLLSHCKECLAVLSDYQSVISALGLETEPVPPPNHLKERVMANLGKLDVSDNGPGEQPSMHVTRKDNLHWQERFPGILTKTLFKDSQRKQTTMLVKMEAGSTLPKHIHYGTEESFVIEGSCTMEGVHYAAGDYMRVTSGHVHQKTVTEEGCLLFVKLPKIEFLA